MLPKYLQCGDYSIPLDRPLIMGIVNVTPDSFSDGGNFLSPSKAVEHAQKLILEGADMLDIGGVSTRPGAPDISASEEITRLLPVLQSLRDCDVPISVDTKKPEVMQMAIENGASMINDIHALQSPEALKLIATHNVAVCLMHGGKWGVLHARSESGEIVQEVLDFLRARVDACEAAGISRDRIVIDPGYGFWKGLEGNIRLLQGQSELQALELPILTGWSRKGTIGVLTDRQEPTDRVFGSIAAALRSIENGANIVRVHDVAAMSDALVVWRATGGEKAATVLKGNYSTS